MTPKGYRDDWTKYFLNNGDGITFTDYNGISLTVGSLSHKQIAMSLIKKVIFNNPATIVLWSDGTKTVVKCDERDEFDPEKGLAMAVCKQYFGNSGLYNDIFKKWIPEEKDDQIEGQIDFSEIGKSRYSELIKSLNAANERLKETFGISGPMDE